jgi:hypothetical protein
MKAQNKIVAVAESSTDVLKMAYEKTKAKIMYINKVGEEKNAMRKRIRQYEFQVAEASEGYSAFHSPHESESFFNSSFPSFLKLWL